MHYPNKKIRTGRHQALLAGCERQDLGSPGVHQGL
jgi:hypothetical protein